jgi:hypothetical protein
MLTSKRLVAAAISALALAAGSVSGAVGAPRLGRTGAADELGGNSYEQCAALEAGIETPEGFLQISYPYTFHAMPGDPFPNLRAHNREQCARALWTFHTLESYLPAPPAG